MVGNWWWEQAVEKQFGAIYPLVMEELEGLPQQQWPQKVEDISKHFAYGLMLKKTANSELAESVLKRIDKQGYALSQKGSDSKLVHKVKDSDYLLLISLDSYETEYQEFEKDTRGYRYFLNKMTNNSDHPEKDFERFKAYFGVELSLINASDFETQQPEMMQTLRLHELHFRRSGSTSPSYILTENKKFVVSIAPDNNLKTIRSYYKYLSTLLPAVLLGLGALIWLFLFRKELITLKKASVALGRGDLDTRTHLSKNSTLHELSSAFNTMAERIQQLLEDHKDLTNAVSHELKTPISRLRFALEMQQESTDDKEKAYYTEKIESNIQTLQDLIDELLGYTRMQRGVELDLQPHNVNEWIANEVGIFSDYHPNLTFETDITITKPISFDRQQMTRVLNNLLDNATKHTRSIVKVSATLKAHEFVLTVEDNGGGITPDDCDKIFEPFTRLDKSRQRDKGNYGLGLAIVKSIVGLHQGEVKCSPSVLGGARFVVCFPSEI